MHSGVRRYAYGFKAVTNGRSGIKMTLSSEPLCSLRCRHGDVISTAVVSRAPPETASPYIL